MAAQDLIGQRIKAIRRQRGLSQAQLAHPELSDSYVSLIESGKRTPTPAVLELLAQKLDCSLTYLINGVTAEQMQELELALRFARMALDNGEAEESRRRYAELLADNNLAGLASMWQEARYGYALALEACGALDEAIMVLGELNDSAGEAMTGERKIAVALALCRCHREHGDLSAAVRVGEEALAAAVQSAGWTDEAVELGATLLGVYLTRGDLLRAEHFAAELLSVAESLGTPRATVASCWNAAAVAEQAGRMDEAMALIERATAIQSETGDPRNLARIRNAYAFTLLRTRPEEAERALGLLLRAEREHETSATSPFDKARCAYGIGWAELVLGRPENAREHLTAAMAQLPTTRTELYNHARLLRSQAYFMLHQDDDCAAELRAVTDWLDTVPATRKTAETWMTLAEMHRRIGDDAQGVAAYQRALACADL